ncbi:hypothetical protein AS188_10090 [Kocuria flava]|uniref:DUF304 domain-containing protein n=1 Tax=Kocuria flava TaxID=446860 RepID=A0A0U2XP65_9MICC|nr:hypothetical protein [Kocuria flava]ALU40034.1 hypothetical protein AS188_10090 [Kocuria flava]GEO91546.1 hypothetical protein KFL01_08520 [Kocuria flava]
MTPDPSPAPETSVTGSPVVHVLREQPEDLFWRGAAVVGLFFLAVLAGLFIGVPAWLMIAFGNPWLLFTLIPVAAGVLLLVKTVDLLRRGAWHARHRSTCTLHEAGIETTEWSTVGADAPVRRSIPWADVASVVASYRIVRRIVLVQNGGGALTESAPVLHVLFDQDGRRQITSVPFSSHQDPAVDTWITELRKHGVELGYTARALSWRGETCLSTEAQLGYFATTEEVVPFPVTGGWLENAVRLENRWHQHAEQLRDQPPAEGSPRTR